MFFLYKFIRKPKCIIYLLIVLINFPTFSLLDLCSCECSSCQGRNVKWEIQMIYFWRESFTFQLSHFAFASFHLPNNQLCSNAAFGCFVSFFVQLTSFGFSNVWNLPTFVPECTTLIKFEYIYFKLIEKSFGKNIHFFSYFGSYK